MPGGRPSEYSDEVAARICADLAEGRSLRSICDDEEMPAARTVHYWLHEKPEFLRQYREAREIQADNEFDEIREIADLATPEDVSVAKLRVDARKWRASKLKPGTYGDRITQEHVGKDGGAIETKDTSMTEIARRMAFVLASAMQDDKSDDGS